MPPGEVVVAPSVSVITADWASALIKASPRTSTFGEIEAGVAPGAVKFVTTAQHDHVYSLQAILTNELHAKCIKWNRHSFPRSAFSILECRFTYHLYFDGYNFAQPLEGHKIGERMFANPRHARLAMSP